MLADSQSTEGIRMWQQLMQDIHPVVQEQLIKIALVLFEDAKSCEIEVKLPSEVNVYLKPYTGFKYYYNKYIKRLDKHHTVNARKLIQSFQFWMPCDRTGKRPKITVFWQ